MAASSSLLVHSTLGKDGVLQLSLKRVPVPEPKDDEVVVRVEASPINPSDLGVLLTIADVSTARPAAANEAGPVTHLNVPEKVMRHVASRVGQSLPVGNEGAGVVVKAGKRAQALLGKTVGVVGGAMWSEYRTLKVNACLPFPDGVTPKDGASWFVNPMTALAMIETMRREGHKALVHTAAASNLGQMLNKLCIADGIGLVNVVRKQDQAELLRKLGAAHVVVSSEPTFLRDLTAAIAATGATLAFDAVAGGQLATQILGCMEAAANSKSGAGWSTYGSDVHKQVYIYGILDTSPVTLTMNAGFSWGVGGWLLHPQLEKFGPQVRRRLMERIAAEIRTTFASSYVREVSLTEVLEVSNIQAYARKATGEKFLVQPHRHATSKL